MSTEEPTCRICAKTFQSKHSVANHRSQAHEAEKIKEEMLAALSELAAQLGRTPYASEMQEQGHYSAGGYQRRFGSWNNAVEMAGLKRTRVWNQQVVACTWCGAEFEKKFSHAQEHTEHFCNDECMGKWKSQQYSGSDNPRYNSLEIPCKTCGATLRRADWKRAKTKWHFCDNSCRAEWFAEYFSGPGSPRWKGGPQAYGPGFNRKKRQRVRDRDDNRCADCGMTSEEHHDEIGMELHVHHITPARQFDDPKERNAMSNLVTLCASCHKKWEGIPLAPDRRDT